MSNARSKPPYPLSFPLVVQRDVKEARKAVKGHTLTIGQVELVQLGFRHDCWMPLSIARRWKTGAYPVKPTRKAVAQWEQYCWECSSVAAIGAMSRPNSTRQNVRDEIEAGIQHDNELMEGHLATSAHRLPCELADGQLWINSEPFRLDPPEWNVLEAIAKHGALNKTQLGRLSNVGDDAVNVLKDLSKKYAALRVRLPGGKGKGGYWANVKLREAPKS